MSKKKAFSGSTMTLKDFHGGSIPSDLPLPSAPGAIVRPSDRSQTPWGNSMNRSDHRSRPGSSSANRNFDDKASFLSHPLHIGRNFDEDERKPLDGVSHPRRTISDDVIRATQSRPEPKRDSLTTAKLSAQQVLDPVSQFPGAATNSYGSRYSESVSVGVNNQIPGGNNNHQVVPNAWGVRKEVGGFSEPVHSSTWSEQNAASKFAQASALEKVSSGRWQTKQVHHHQQQPDVEVIHLSGAESDYHFKDQKAYNGVNPMSEIVHADDIRGTYGEKGWVIEDGSSNGGKELPNIERAKSPMYPEAKESNSPLYPDVVRPTSTEGKYGGSKFQAPVPQEVSERPKLKLLPRSKPLEVSEPSVMEHKPGYEKVNGPGHVAAANEFYGNVNAPKPGSAGNEGGNPAVERPKLNLKPRAQIVAQLEETAARERKSVFGGARPRELVLKERGIDDMNISNLDLQSPNRVKPDIHKMETKPDHVVYAERLEKVPADQKKTRDPETKDIRGDSNKIDGQRSSWRRESWRNGTRVTEKQHQQQQETRAEPETWRKPVDQPNPAPSDGQGGYRKAASALELAQAFSSSVSTNQKKPDRISGQKGISSQSQIPFSRLTATATQELYSGRTPRRQINGY